MSERDFWPKLIAANRAGERRGVPSWCTAHPQTLARCWRPIGRATSRS